MDKLLEVGEELQSNEVKALELAKSDSSNTKAERDASPGLS
jgi:hypothetical protein